MIMKLFQSSAKPCHKHNEFCIVCIFKPFLLTANPLGPIRAFSFPKNNQKCYFNINEKLKIVSYFILFFLMCLSLFLVYEHFQLCNAESLQTCLILFTQEGYHFIGVIILTTHLLVLNIKLHNLNTWKQIVCLCNQYGMDIRADEDFNKTIQRFYVTSISGSIFGLCLLIVGVVNFHEIGMNRMITAFLAALSNHIQMFTISQLFVTQRILLKYYSAIQLYLSDCLNKTAENRLDQLQNINNILLKICGNYMELNKILGFDIIAWLLAVITLLIINVYLVVKDWMNHGDSIVFVMARTVFVIIIIMITLFKAEYSSSKVSNYHIIFCLSIKPHQIVEFKYLIISLKLL